MQATHDVCSGSALCGVWSRDALQSISWARRHKEVVAGTGRQPVRLAKVTISRLACPFSINDRERCAQTMLTRRQNPRSVELPSRILFAFY